MNSVLMKSRAPKSRMTQSSSEQVAVAPIDIRSESRAHGAKYGIEESGVKVSKQRQLIVELELHTRSTNGSSFASRHLVLRVSRFLAALA